MHFDAPLHQVQVETARDSCRYLERLARFGVAKGEHHVDANVQRTVLRLRRNEGAPGAGCGRLVREPFDGWLKTSGRRREPELEMVVDLVR
ncbi:hypothetical protein D3C81_1069820 [compost metagenome]